MFNIQISKLLEPLKGGGTMVQVVATEFFISVSMSDLVHCTSESEDTYEPVPSLFAALKEAGLSVDLRRLYFQYFDEIQIGQGDVYRYSSNDVVESIFVIDMYREPDDQFDLVSIGFSCSEAKSAVVASHVHAFFRQASFQVALEQSSHSARFRKLIDSTQYPFVLQKSGYVQKLIALLTN